MMKVAVVTPTIASPYLKQCLKSVDEQTYENLTHYVFIDGHDHYYDAMETCVGASKVKTVILEQNVGKDWYGHRVYAACSFLVDADVICYLDEDNWFEPNHVESLVKVLEEGNSWAYSLRKIYNKQGEYLVHDNCESLGKWPVFFDDKVNHIDTSSFAIRKDVAVQIGHAWYGQWGADRQFYSALKQYFPKYDCTRENTLCYRLDGNPNSVTEEFFITGNNTMSAKYNREFPWRIKENIVKVAPGVSIVL